MHNNKQCETIVLIPSYNDLDKLKILIKDIKKISDIFVVNDGSTDNTDIWLKNQKIRHINNKKNIGYEKSLLIGIKILKKKKYKYLITFDADGQHKIIDLKKIINNKIFANYDVVLCNRDNLSRILEKVISYVFFKKYKIKDPVSGFKIYKKKVFNEIKLNEIKNFFLVDLLISLIKKKKNIMNYKIRQNKRKDKPRIGNFIKINYNLLSIIYLILVK